MKNNIEGRVIIVTGASSGIGETVAKHLASLGAEVSLGSRRKEKLDQCCGHFRDHRFGG